MNTLAKILTKAGNFLTQENNYSRIGGQEKHLVYKKGETATRAKNAPSQYQTDHLKAKEAVKTLKAKPSEGNYEYESKHTGIALREFFNDAYDVNKGLASKMGKKIYYDKIMKDLDESHLSTINTRKTSKGETRKNANTELYKINKTKEALISGYKKTRVIVSNSASGVQVTVSKFGPPNDFQTIHNVLITHEEIEALFPSPNKTKESLATALKTKNLGKETPFQSNAALRQEELLLASMMDAVEHTNEFPEEYIAPDQMSDKLEDMDRYYRSGLISNQVLFDQSFSQVGISPTKFFGELDDWDWGTDGIEPNEIYNLTSYSKEFKKAGIDDLGEAQNKLVDLSHRYSDLSAAEKQLARKLAITIREIHHIGKLVQTMKIETDTTKMNPNPDYINKFRLSGVESINGPSKEHIKAFEDKPEVFVAGLIYMSGGLQNAINKGYVSFDPRPESEDGDMLVINAPKIPLTYTSAIYKNLKDTDTDFKVAKIFEEGTYSITDATHEIFNKPENRELKAQLDRVKLEDLKENKGKTNETEKVKIIASLISNPVAPYFSEDGSYTLTSDQLRDGATIDDKTDIFTREMPDKTLYEHLVRNSLDKKTGQLSITKLETYLNSLRVKAVTKSFSFSDAQLKEAGFDKGHEGVMFAAKSKFDLQAMIDTPGRRLSPNHIKLARLGIMSDLVKTDEGAKNEAENLARLDREKRVQFGVVSYLAAKNLDLKQAGIIIGPRIPLYVKADKEGNVTSVSLAGGPGITTEGFTLAGYIDISKQYKDGDRTSFKFGAGLEEGLIAGISFVDSNEKETAHTTYSAGVIKIFGIPVGIAASAGGGQTRIEQVNDTGYEILEETHKLSYEDLVALRGLAAKHKALDNTNVLDRIDSQEEFITELYARSGGAKKYFQLQSEFYDNNTKELRKTYPDKASFLASNLEGIVNATMDTAAVAEKNAIGYELGAGIGWPLLVGAYIKIDLPNNKTVIKTINTTSSVEHAADRQAQIDAQIAEDLKTLEAKNPDAQFVTNGMTGDIIRTGTGWEMRNTKDLNVVGSKARNAEGLPGALNEAYNDLGLQFTEITDKSKKAQDFKNKGYVQLNINSSVINSDIALMIDPDADIDIVSLRTTTNPDTGLNEFYFHPGHKTLAITQHTIWPDRGAENPRIIYTISNKHTDRDALNDIDNPANIIEIRNGHIGTYERNNNQKNVGVGMDQTPETLKNPAKDKIAPMFEFSPAEQKELDKYNSSTSTFEADSTGSEAKFTKEKVVLNEIIALIAKHDKGTGRTKSMKIFLDATTSMEASGYKTEIEGVAAELIEHFTSGSTVIPNKISMLKLMSIQPSKITPKGAAYLIDQMTNMTMVNISKMKPARKENTVKGRSKLFDKYMTDKTKYSDKSIWKMEEFKSKESEISTSAKTQYEDMLENTSFGATSVKATDKALEDYMCGTLVGKYPKYKGNRKVLIDQNSFIKILSNSKTSVDNPTLQKFYTERNDHIHEGMDLNESPLARKLLAMKVTLDGKTQPLLSLIARIHSPKLNTQNLLSICADPKSAKQDTDEYKFIVGILKELRNGGRSFESKDGMKLDLKTISDVQTAFIEPCGNFAAFTNEDIQVSLRGTINGQQQFLGGSGESGPGGEDTNVTGGSLLSFTLGVATKIEDKEPPPDTPDKPPATDTPGGGPAKTTSTTNAGNAAE